MKGQRNLFKTGELNDREQVTVEINYLQKKSPISMNKRRIVVPETRRAGTTREGNVGLG